MRKMFLLLALSFMALSLSAQGPKVRTSAGTIEGMDCSGVKTFLGVPFAAPPVGDLRWKAPQPVERWSGVRKTVEYGPNPMQQPIFGDMNFGTKKMSEDCLYLNVWTPAKTMDEKLPVLIYFNGGGLMAGSGSEPRYAGHSMARRGIVSVTANYREGIFGFFAHPQLSKETVYKGSGNYGFLDQIAAIQWVKDNIAAFGGDPSRITIVGESAGSMSVSILMASPLCKGLFAQAMGASGSVVGFKPIATLKEAEKTGQEQAKKIGCKSVSELRALSAEELMEKAAVSSVPVYNIDGYFMLEQPYDVYRTGKQVKVPLLVGGNSMEMTPAFILRGQPATLANAKAAARPLFGDDTDAVLSSLGMETDADVEGQPGVDLASMMFIDYSTWKWAEMHKQTGGQPVYRYRFCQPRPELKLKDKVAGLAGGVQDKKGDEPQKPEVTGAVHSADIEYAMGNLSTNRLYDWTPTDWDVSDIFQSYYVNFVRTGNPNGLGLPVWTPANGSDVSPEMQIDAVTRQEIRTSHENAYKLVDGIVWKQK